MSYNYFLSSYVRIIYFYTNLIKSTFFLDLIIKILNYESKFTGTALSTLPSATSLPTKCVFNCQRILLQLQEDLRVNMTLFSKFQFNICVKLILWAVWK